MKLWQTSDSLNPDIEKFTTGSDPVLDMSLIPFDCIASIAHVTMLQKIDVLTKSEMEKLIAELENIRDLHAKGKFVIQPEDEDGHTAIEKHLTEALGDIGKKVHTGRSRNDQVLTAIRLFEKNRLSQIIILINNLIETLDGIKDYDGLLPMPGYTHTRKAMPFSVGQWIDALQDALKDDLVLIESTFKIIDKNPLGTGAGYGVPIPLDRHMTTAMLGFSEMLVNPMTAQNSRGKLESAILHNCLMVLFDLNKWASDVILFSMPEIGYFKLNQDVTTGSSIMPHKRNPDVFELIRAAFGVVSGYELQSRMIPANLISGYHRDLQWSKEPVMRGLDLTIEVLKVSMVAAKSIEADHQALEKAMTPEIKSVKEVMDLVAKGIPFRDAYRQISQKYKA